MIDTIIVLFRSGVVLLFGLAVTLLFAGVKHTRLSEFVIVIFYLFIIFIQLTCWQMFGLEFTMKLYPFITHIPIVIFISLFFKRSWLITISSTLTAYLCCQIPKWIGSVAVAILGGRFAEHIAYFFAVCAVFYFLQKYVAASVIQVMERSIRSCLLFTAVPLLYYIFDYATSVYTELLYTGAPEAVQFTPSVISTFYLIFVLLYNNETQKQVKAQRERDIFASQLQQSQNELENMRQMQHNTMIYRHDMRHHLTLIAGYAAEGDLNKIKEYLISTEAAIDALTPVRYCENETVNLIISSFMAKAKKLSVCLQANVNLSSKLNMNDTELCALLSNALENAINAVSLIEDELLRKVYLHALINDNRLLISTENAYVGQIEMDGELPKSSKKEAGHGYGIKSIIDIINRHDGLYSIETDSGIFVLQLMIPLS